MVNWGLILLNVLVFIYEFEYTVNFTSRRTDLLFVQYGVVPYYIINALLGVQTFRLYSLVTSMFMHAGFFHIFGNMLFLFVFGDNVEDRFGHVGYLFFYLLAGVGGALTQVYISFLSGPPDVFIPSLGASAAISGVLAAYLLFFPKARVVSIIGYFIIPVKAFWFIIGWFLLQILFSSVGINTGVAYGAHVGGFLVGLIIGGIARVFMKPVEEEL